MLIDSTLREGAQAYGIYLGRSARRQVAAMLAQAGVDEIEAGWMGQEVEGEGLEPFLAWARETLRGRAGTGQARTRADLTDASQNISAQGPAWSVWCPCREADARAAGALAAAGLVQRVNIGAPSSAAHRSRRLGLSLADMTQRVETVVALAREAGAAYVSVGLEDISRASPEEALRLAWAAVHAGAARIRLSDTVGLLTPLETQTIVGRFAAALPVPVGFHGHNDLGLATANAVTALQAGASWVDASILGIGERAGIAALEEVAAWLTLRATPSREPHDPLGGGRYDLPVVRRLCGFVAEATGIPLARNKSIAGEDIFAAESGLHVHGLRRDPTLFEPFAPQAVGAVRRLSLGAKSGRAALAGEVQGPASPDGAVTPDPRPENAIPGASVGESVLNRVRDLAWRLGRPLSQAEVDQLRSASCP